MKRDWLTQDAIAVTVWDEVAEVTYVDGSMRAVTPEAGKVIAKLNDLVIIKRETEDYGY